MQKKVIFSGLELHKIELPISLNGEYSIIFNEFTKANNMADYTHFLIKDTYSDYFTAYSSNTWKEETIVSVIGYCI